MSSYILPFQEIDRTKRELVGGKGANLGDIFKVEDIVVPGGFCVTTRVYKDTVLGNNECNSLIEQLTLLSVENGKALSEVSEKIRKVIEQISIPHQLDNELSRQLEYFGKHDSYAVRSSATAEDLLTASFAGQQDTFLNISGKEAILRHITKCWASLFNDRAITYRIQNGFDHRQVSIAVVIQKMIIADAAGVMFTADPVTSNRKILSIDTGLGTGEAIVSGHVNTNSYKVRDGIIIARGIANIPILSDHQVLTLEQIGKRIENHFGYPQDIEWCMTSGAFYIVQCRPITNLYPIPESKDNGNHVYISIGHLKMMTEPLRPLGLSMWGIKGKAGGRLFVDVTEPLSQPENRKVLLSALEQHDPLMKDALNIIIDRGDFLKPLPVEKTVAQERGPGGTNEPKNDIDPEGVWVDSSVVSALIKDTEQALELVKKDIQSRSGSDLFDFISSDMRQLNESLFNSRSVNVIMAALNALAWINEKMYEWLGEKNAADVLSQSVPNNITSEMGVELLEIAELIHDSPEVMSYLEQVKDDNFLDNLGVIAGGERIRDAIIAYLDKYGMRCVAEVDITRPRWIEKPATLIPMILSSAKSPRDGYYKINKYEQGLQQALKKEKELLGRLRQLEDGDKKAQEAKRKIDLMRNFIGYREYPKYSLVSRHFVYKLALMKEAEQLVQAGVIGDKEDVFYLTFTEFRDAVITNNVDYRVINQRKHEYHLFEKLIPPRVITSDGEVFVGEYKRENIPQSALIGLAASSGVVEGRARVILNIEDADLDEGDILVTTFTDPAWTPLFLSIKGLVTEVGGLLTHGAIIAREYGLPAVLGVKNATKLIKDGQRIRIHGAEGYVETL